MSMLIDCTPELIINIYQCLDNIDDALHLARCCRHTHAVFETHRLFILKSIIVSSLLSGLSSDLLSGYTRAPDELYPTAAVFQQAFHASSLSDQQVWDVMARWQGLRLLQDLYLNPAIQSKYRDSPCETGMDAPGHSKALDILVLAQEEQESSHSHRTFAAAPTFSPDETGQFYKALTAYWAATEGLKLASHFRCPENTEEEIRDGLEALWHRRSNLQESLNTLEVTDFTYRFLCQQIGSMSLESFIRWPEEWRIEVEDSFDEASALFTRRLWLALNPADVLELLCFTSLRREKDGDNTEIWPTERRQAYLQARGFCFAYRVHGHGLALWYSTPDLEEACRQQLERVLNDHSAEAPVAWSAYRTLHWKAKARGQFGARISASLLEFVKFVKFGVSGAIRPKLSVTGGKATV